MCAGYRGFLSRKNGNTTAVIANHYGSLCYDDIFTQRVHTLPPEMYQIFLGNFNSVA